MSRFGDLMGGNVTPPTPPVPVEPEPDVIEGDSDEGQVDLESLSKVELEEFGRELGIELDRRHNKNCLLYTSPSPRDVEESRMPSSA